MNFAKDIFLLISIIAGCITSYASTSFNNETLNYVVQYKWGIVEKNAATATLRLVNKPNDYDILLTAKTLPWADKIFMVRDTLISKISKSDFKPISYTKITHENNKYRKDLLTYTYSGRHAYGRCVRIKENPGAPVKKNVISCSATGSTYDMLSIFYYIRALDFSQLGNNKIVKANVFSGSGAEVIKIKCLGRENVKIPSGKTYPCYHLQFTFTMHGRSDSSKPIDAWISSDAQHIPVKMVGTLPIGQVRCFLTSVTK